MDPTSDESCPHIEVPICICIGLLCMLKLIILENDGISISKIKVVLMSDDCYMIELL